MKADTVLAIFGAAFLLAACGAKEATDIPPESELNRGVLAHVEAARWTHVYLVDMNGTRCAVLRIVGESGGISCDWNRPPIYGDVEPAAMNAGCTTDTDCMEKFGGDGGPAPRSRF